MRVSYKLTPPVAVTPTATRLFVILNTECEESPRKRQPSAAFCEYARVYERFRFHEIFRFAQYDKRVVSFFNKKNHGAN